jgi:hypothetical protein
MELLKNMRLTEYRAPARHMEISSGDRLFRLESLHCPAYGAVSNIEKKQIMVHTVYSPGNSTSGPGVPVPP